MATHQYVIVSDKLESLMDKQVVLDRVQKAIEEGCLMIEADAKAYCPVDTGNLRASIHTTIGNLEGAVGTPVEYAPYVEFGTRKMTAQPYLGPAFYENEQKIIDHIAKEVLDR